jgi:pimeloyl-ACP methyl ester carboxylesterase
MWEHSRIVVLCACVASSACSGEDDEKNGPADSTRPAGSVTWRACGSAQCAEVPVPLDHSAPEGESLAIAINRVQADGQVPYRGVLFINPGGPGAEGKSFVADNARVLRAVFSGFDIVGFDPRGTGESGALKCALEADLASEYARGRAAAVRAAFQSEGQRCAEGSGPIFDRMGSNQVVEDIDLVRRALGHAELNFLGISYGTRLAALYARKFPENARAIVLDAPVAPSGDLVELVEGQFDALLASHGSFFAACAAKVLDCPPEPEQVFESLVNRFEASGELDQFVSFWHFMLASPPGRELLAQGLREEAGEAAGGMMAGGMEGMPSTEDLLPQVNVAANITINCSDNTHAPLSAVDADATMARFESLAPAFATQGLAALSCGAWPVRNDPVPTAPFTPRLPALVIGGTEDILTPYAWAEEAALLLGGANLLKSGHYGHGATAFGSRCVFDWLQNYLVDPRQMPPDLSCAAP